MKKLILSLGLFIASTGLVFAQPGIQGPISYASGGSSSAGGGAGTVTTITGGTGILPSTNPCTVTCILNTTVTPNTQTGTSYALLATDGGKFLTGSNASSQAYTLSQANQTGFTAGYGFELYNKGAGGLTLTATTSTFGNALTSLVLATGQDAFVSSDGTNYQSAVSLPVMVADTVLGNFSATTNYPIAGAIPGCASDGSHALTFASHAFACTAVTGGSASPGGSDTQFQYNNAGSFGGISTLVNVSGAITNSKAGAVSAPALTMSGAPFTGGSTTTTFPLLYLNSGGAVSTFSTAGAFYGANSPSGFTGRFLDFHVNGGVSVFAVNNSGSIQIGGSDKITFSGGSIFLASFTGVGSNGVGLGATTPTDTAPSLTTNWGGSGSTGWGGTVGTLAGIVGGVTKIKLTTEGLQYKQVTAPTVTGTGSPTIATSSTDESGEVTSGASATSVVITFNLTHTNAPFCVVTPQSTLISFAYTLSNTAITITQTATSSEKINYRCTFP